MDSTNYKLLKTDDKTYLVDTYRQINVCIIHFNRADFWQTKANEIRFYVIDPVYPLAFETVGYMGEDQIQIQQMVNWYLQKTGRTFMAVPGNNPDDTIDVFEFFNIDTAKALGSRWFSSSLSGFIVSESLEAFKIELAYRNRVPIGKIEWVQIPLELAVD